MGKTKRGKNIKSLTYRGTCPACSRTRVKLMWEGKAQDDSAIKVCKVCASGK